MKPTKTFDPKVLRKLINYDPATGIMLWKRRVAGDGITEGRANHFNAIFAGREALYHYAGASDAHVKGYVKQHLGE